VPTADRTHPLAAATPAVATPPVPGAPRPDLGPALAVLLDPSLAHVVDLVAWAQDGQVHVADAAGHACVPRDDPGRGWTTVRGRNPVADQDPLAGGGIPGRPETPSTAVAGAGRSYPHAAERLVDALADPDRAPDLWVVHTPDHHWPEREGHLGEHGSLNVGQSRAPLLLSGAGVAARGPLPRSARTVDVAPTLLAALGVAMPGVHGTPLDLVAPGAARVVGLLWDGAHPGELDALADAGELPAVQRLREHGCWLTGGAIAAFPSVTLVNHTSALTGVGPGRHGIVHNVFYDRRSGERVLANDSATWHRACELLRPGVRTVWEVLAEARPGALSACVDEPVDRGAGYSTFGLVRDAGAAGGASGLTDALPSADDDPLATAAFVAALPDYRWGSQIDRLGLDQMLGLFGGADGTGDPAAAPVLTWWNSTLTDAGHHAGGPGSDVARAALRDTDRRLGVFLDRLEALGLLADTCILLTADHGSERADETVRGDWDAALVAAGVTFRDEGYGAIYLPRAGGDGSGANGS
jgi:phosphonoacetate hydrolase